MRSDAARVGDRLARGLAAGDVLLLHDGRAARTSDGVPVVVAALPTLVAAIRARGLTTDDTRVRLRVERRMKPDATAGSSTQAIVDAAASRYRDVGAFAWRFARGKLAGDPLFETLLSTGAIPDAACLVDLGCGQGLLAAWLHAASDAWRANGNRDRWPEGWPAPPKVSTYLGVDRSRRDIARAKPAMPPFARVFRGDLRTLGMTMLDRCDVVTLLDVLQYLDAASQERLLGAIAASLPPWGVVVLRIGDGATWPGLASDLIDLVVSALRGHPHRRLHRRPLDEWRGLLEGHGFDVEVLHDERASTNGSRGFANVLLRATRRAAPTAG